jgi:putative heme iron utilization protein
MPSAVEVDVVRLILGERWGAIATLDGGAPLASMVAYAPEPALDSVLLFLSRLSRHTRNLLEDPRASLAISRPDSGQGDPQLLPRVTLTGTVEDIGREAGAWGPAAGTYLARFPDAAPRFALADFHLLRLRPVRVRYVGGFATALNLTVEQLRGAASALASGMGGR